MSPAEKLARQRLAEQISAHNTIEGQIEKTRSMLAEGKRKLSLMLDEFDQAEARKAAEQDAEIDRILSGAPKAKGSSQAPALSEADISLQKRLVERLEEVETESESSLASAKRAVAAGVSGVVAARVNDLIPEMEKARAEFARLAAAFTAARSAIEHDRDGPYDRIDRFLRSEPAAASRFVSLAPAEEARWRSQIAQLARNPDAPLH
jgi:signal recognition particle GTPase